MDILDTFSLSISIHINNCVYLYHPVKEKVHNKRRSKKNIWVEGWEGVPWNAVFWTWDGHSTSKLTAAVAICRESIQNGIFQYSIKDGEGLNKHPSLPNACWKGGHCYLKCSVVHDQQVTCLLWLFKLHKWKTVITYTYASENMEQNLLVRRKCSVGVEGTLEKGMEQIWQKIMYMYETLRV